MKKISRETFEQVKWIGLKLSETKQSKSDLEKSYTFYGEIEPKHCIELAAILLLWVEYDKESNNNSNIRK